MDFFIVFSVLGAVGLCALVIMSLGHASADRAADAAQVADLARAAYTPNGHHAGGHDPMMGHHQGLEHGSASRTLVSFPAPRMMFSLFLGFGVAGQLLSHVLGGPTLFLSALLGGLLFERFAASPLWRLFTRRR